MRTLVAVGACFVGLFGVPGPLARAQEAPEAEGDVASDEDEGLRQEREEEARALFQAGRYALADGRFEEALRNFRRSYELSGRPELLFNMGSVHEQLQQDARAVRAYERYLAERPDAPNRRSVERRLELLRSRVDDAAATPDAEPAVEESGGALWEQWWFWTMLGAAAVAGVTVGVVLGTVDAGVQEPLPGRDGAVLMTLVEWSGP